MKQTTQVEMQNVIPRAEFRIFGQGIIARMEKAIWHAQAHLYAVRDMPAEVYFVSRKNSHANIKVRNELLDIKKKTGETQEGYEIFQPAGKFSFPLKKQDVQQVLTALGVEADLRKEEYDSACLMDMAKAHPDIYIAEVRKKRYGFSVDGVICEYAQVMINGASIETACCESEDYEKIHAVAQKLGIDECANTNYMAAIKGVLGL